MDLKKQTIVSGINPSSSAGLHLGNFLGAAKNHVEMQSEVKRAYYFVANYHSLNSVFDPKEVEENTMNVYMDYLAFGLKPDLENVFFFVESGVPEIAELNLILNNVVTMAELKRMHAFKDKFSKGVSENSINHGLFNYPVLMASDIIMFEATIVPVGEDQRQHVEIARDIARAFNRRYGEVLEVPEVMIKKETAKVIGTDGERKMSKSLGNSISVFTSEEEIRKQIFATKTDPARIHPDDPGDPKKNVLFSYMRFLDYKEDDVLEFEERYRQGTVGDVEIKKDFYEYFLEYFKQMRARREELQDDNGKVEKLIKENNEAVRKIAFAKIVEVRKAVGLT